MTPAVASSLHHIDATQEMEGLDALYVGLACL